MDGTIFLAGGRDARGVLDAASAGDRADADVDVDADVGAGAAVDADLDACVVACPPHPQHGGDRTDPRLRAVSDELTARGVDCLRFDYGAWDGGRGERADALRAVEWADQRYDRVVLFGYSFGGAVALSGAAASPAVVAVAALAPPALLGTARPARSREAGTDGDVGGIDAAADLMMLRDSLPVGIFYGSRDDVADVAPVVAAARERDATVVEFPTDHRFVGRESEVAAAVVEFLTPALQPDP